MPMSVVVDRCRLACLTAVCLICLTSCALTRNAPPDSFARLVELSAVRLQISRQVALTKWDSGFPVADPPGDPREQQVVNAAAAEAARRGVSSELARAFVADQIEASKLVQIALIADWRRARRAPEEPRADLRAQLRPALDGLLPRFVDELQATRPQRETPDCRLRLADAIAHYAEAHGLAPLWVVALDRALARVCGD
jgi:chorismate mutase